MAFSNAINAIILLIQIYMISNCVGDYSFGYCYGPEKYTKSVLVAQRESYQALTRQDPAIYETRYRDGYKIEVLEETIENVDYCCSGYKKVLKKKDQLINNKLDFWCIPHCISDDYNPLKQPLTCDGRCLFGSLLADGGWIETCFCGLSSSGTVINGRKVCDEPNGCRDSSSYKATGLHQTCFKGKCINNHCVCDKGYEGNMCKPKCWVGSPNEYSVLPKTCFHGFCSSEDICECNPGYERRRHGFDFYRVETQCQQKCRDRAYIKETGTNQTCFNGKCTGPDSCECESGYEGKTCQHPKCRDDSYSYKDSGLKQTCFNAKCIGLDFCECNDGYEGEIKNGVQICHPKCRYSSSFQKTGLPQTCFQGKCIDLETCECDDGFQGKECKNHCPAGTWGTDCKDRCAGSCRAFTDDGKYIGLRCDGINGQCSCPNIVREGAACLDDILYCKESVKREGYWAYKKCNCSAVYYCVPWAHDCSSLSGWKEYRFFDQWAACFRSECPCKNGGLCKPDDNFGYKCDCSSGFTGKFCKDPKDAGTPHFSGTNKKNPKSLSRSNRRRFPQCK